MLQSLPGEAEGQEGVDTVHWCSWRPANEALNRRPLRCSHVRDRVLQHVKAYCALTPLDIVLRSSRSHQMLARG
eukprot:4577606-Amphidinium_carterae.1